MSSEELRNLVECYYHIEGYTDIRSILNVLSQEYPGEYDWKEASQIIIAVIKKNY